MIAPWSVNMMLYVSADMIDWRGVSSSVRISRASTPPRKNDASTETMYITPMRLWSRVNSHDWRPRVCVR